jgi:hypothetical protein
MYGLLILPSIVLVVGILIKAAGNRTKDKGGAIALKVIGILLIIGSLLFFAGWMALVAGFREWN